MTAAALSICSQSSRDERKHFTVTSRVTVVAEYPRNYLLQPLLIRVVEEHNTYLKLQSERGNHASQGICKPLLYT